MLLCNLPGWVTVREDVIYVLWGERAMKRRVFVSSDEQEEPWRNYTSPKRPLTSAAWETLFVVTGGVLGGPAGNAKKRKVVVAPKPTGSVEPVGVVGAEDPMLKVVIQGLSGMDKSSSMGGFSARGNTDQDSVGKPVVDEVRTVAIHETDKEVDDARGSIRRWCDMCEKKVGNGKFRRHVYERHLPWFYAPELACWLCEAAERNSMQLVSHHGVCEEGLFEGSRLSAWIATMGGILESLVSVFGIKSEEELQEMVVRQGRYAMDGNVKLSPTQELLFHLLENAWGRKVKGILSICPPTCPSAVLSWTSLSQLLSRMTESQRLEVRNWKVSPAKWDTLMATAIDAHCHLRMMADRLKCSPQGTLSVSRQRHWSPEICSTSLVRSNCVFPETWDNPPTLTAPEQMLVETRVAFTYGAHPKTEPQAIPWPLLECKIQELECVAVGECGLDGTSQNSLGRQKDIFSRQMNMAAKYGKPLALHLRNGKNLKLDVFETALQMAQKVLPRKQKIYLHSFTGLLNMFTWWQHRFVDILAGLSWLSLQGEEGETLAWSLPFECLALESDAPHLSPLTREMNSPWLLCHHAQVVAQARNLPATVVLERAALNTARFYGLEDDCARMARVCNIHYLGSLQW